MQNKYNISYKNNRHEIIKVLTTRFFGGIY